MRRFTEPSHVAVFSAFFVAVMVVGLIAKDAVTRASVHDVRAAVQSGPTVDAQQARHLVVDEIHLPDWNADDWRLIGARSDLLEDDRDAITGFYRRGEETIALTVIEGTGGLDDSEPTRQVAAYDTDGESTLTLGGVTGGAPPSESGFGDRQVVLGSGLDCADGCVGPPARPVLSVRREFRGRAVVLTAWPVTDAVFREVGAMALQLGR